MRLSILAIIILLITTNAFAGDLSACVEDMVCFRDNFSEIYSQNYSAFWPAWRRYEKAALACESVEKTNYFLSLAMHADGEVAEASAEAIEKLILQNTTCFLAAVEKSPQDVRERVVRNFVLTPIFHNISEITSAIELQLNKNEYPLTEAIFRKTNEGS